MSLSHTLNWNEVIRDLFQDEKLRQYMCIPEETTIINFIDKYFIKAGYTSKTLKNEDVRIVYSDLVLNQENYNVTKNAMSFDIYVRYEKLHDVCNDRLVYRTNVIAQRLLYLLTKERYVHNYRFWIAGESDLGSAAVGYARYNLTLNYLKCYTPEHG